MTRFSIDGKWVGDEESVFIVAEIGKNHNGSEESARRLIDEAYSAGCDCVKFQAHIAEEEMIPSDEVPPHFSEPRYRFIKRVSFSKEQLALLAAYARQKGLAFLCTPFSRRAVDWLESIGVEAYKVGSGDVTDVLLLEYIARIGKPVLLSTGMSSIDDITQAVRLIERYHRNMIILHCTSLYPCPYDYVDLRMIQTLRKMFGYPIGFSDHTADYFASLASVALGACVIEKHFTLDKSLYGPDHKASLVPEEMATLVRGVRAVEKALGDGLKKVYAEEAAMHKTFRKSLVAASPIAKGTIIDVSMLTAKRPGTGISPGRLAEVCGRRAARDIGANELLFERDLQ